MLKDQKQTITDGRKKSFESDTQQKQQQKLRNEKKKERTIKSKFSKYIK